MIAARLAAIANIRPNATAIVAEHRTLTYSELIGVAAGIRRRLEQADAGPGAVVAVSLPSTWQAAATFAACADLGAIYLPVNLAWRRPEISWLIARTRPSVVILAREDEARWPDAGTGPARVFLDGDTVDISPGGAVQWPADHPAVWLVSSGTLGRPRIVPRTHGMVLQSVDATVSVVPAGPGRRWLATVPFHHGSGFSNNLCLPLLKGATLFLQDRFDPARAATLIDAASIDTLFASPAVFSLLDAAAPPATKWPSLTTCLSGGAALPRELAARWRARGRAPIRQFYGSTETSLVCVQTQDCDDPSCVGPPLPHSRIALLDGDTPLTAGATGQIAVSGPGVLDAYIGEPPETSAVFWQGHLRMSDRGSVNAHGHLHLAGRIAPWINVGGIKVDPVEVRRVLTGIPGVFDAAVSAAPGPRGEVVAAVIATAPGACLTKQDVIAHCRQELAEFKIPRQIRFVPAAEMDGTGKLPSPWH